MVDLELRGEQMGAHSRACFELLTVIRDVQAGNVGDLSNAALQNLRAR